MSDTRVPPAVLSLAAVVLLLGMAPMPYGYYALLRIVSCITFCWAAVESHKRRHQMLPWVFALAAILFNPIVRVHFDRGVWVWLNLLAALLLLSTAKRLSATRGDGEFPH